MRPPLARTFRQTSREIDVEMGEYLPFEVICGKESAVGVTRTGLLAALNICEACTRLQGRWCKYNSFSKRLEYL